MKSSLIPLVGGPSSGAVVGEHSDPERDETHGIGSERNQLGGDDESGSQLQSVESVDGDSTVNVKRIIENFNELGKLRLRGKTPSRYARNFERFASAVDLERYSRRQLASRKGRELLLVYLLGKISPASRKTQRATLKSVWEEGLHLPFPVSRRDLGELPAVQERDSPPDEDVLPWVKAVEREEEPYLRGIMLAHLQFGVRPSHVCLFRWKHVRRGQDGRPNAIITTGLEQGNKRMTPVRARVPPDLADVLIELKQLFPGARPEDPIFPHRKPEGSFEGFVQMNTGNMAAQWRRFQAKHALRKLRPVDVRHWVATRCRKAGLSYVATHSLQGQKVNSMHMRDRYDHPGGSDILEEQALVIPFGPVGLLCPKVEVNQALPAELVDALGKSLRGELLPSTIAEMITAYLTRQLNSQVAKIEQ